VAVTRHDAVEAGKATEERLAARLDGQHAKVSDLFSRDQQLDARMSRMEATMQSTSAEVQRLAVADRDREREAGTVAARLNSIDERLRDLIALLREDGARERHPERVR
jgi:chromosome segregation ATPase